MIAQTELSERARRAGVVPVLTIEDAACAVPLATALCEGGLDVLEITLRTPAALEAIRVIASSGLDCVIGAGTILGEEDVSAAEAAGAEFLVTPGTPASLIPALKLYEGVVIPGVSTATEAMALSAEGFNLLKFFPAEPAGGAPFLKALAGPLLGLSFMPTGGIRLESMGAYLKLGNVVAVGGSWIVTSFDIAASDWAMVTQRAREAHLSAGQARSS